MSGRKTFVGGDILLASELNGFLMDQSVMVFDNAAARTAAIPTPSEGMVTYLKNTNTIEAFNGSAYVNVASVGTTGYRFVSTLYFTSNGTFTKATYPWLRAIRVRCQAGGGGGGGSVATSAGQVSVGGGGGGGAYAESFITNIASLASSITVTRGAGGTGVSGAAGNNGGDSSFGSLVSAQGGDSSIPSDASTSILSASSRARIGGTGDVKFGGSAGTNGIGLGATTSRARGGTGGSSHLGGGAGSLSQQAGVNGQVYGSGGSGARSLDGEGAGTGGAGANGIVIVELFA